MIGLRKKRGGSVSMCVREKIKERRERKEGKRRRKERKRLRRERKDKRQ